MITERTPGHSTRGSARRAGFAASHAMSPWAPASRNSWKRRPPSATAPGSVTPMQSKPSARASCTSSAFRGELTDHPLEFVSRTRCSVLHAAPQSRDPEGRRTEGWAPDQQRTTERRGRCGPLRCAASGERDRWWSEVEVHIGPRRRHARQPFAQQRTERRAGFHPRVPCLCRFVLDPWPVAQIIDRRKMRRGGEVRVAEPVAGEKIPRPRQPADIGQMIPHIGLRRADHIRRRRGAPLIPPPEALVCKFGDQRMGGFLKKLFVEPRHQPTHLDALAHSGRQQPALGHGGALGLIEIFGDDAGARDCRLPFGDQHRRRARWVQREKRLAPFPGPLFHQTQVQTVFAENEANKARMRAEWVMKQREHEALDKFLVLRKLSLRQAGGGGAPNYRSL